MWKKGGGNTKRLEKALERMPAREPDSSDGEAEELVLRLGKGLIAGRPLQAAHAKSELPAALALPIAHACERQTPVRRES